MEKEEFQNPYYIFPEDVWEEILEKLEDSKDIQNVLKAFPVLEEDLKFSKKKSYWLMDQVLPFIATKTRWKPDGMLYGSILFKFDNQMKELLLTCRLVCKRWATAVDKLLENKFQINDHRPQNKLVSDWNDYQSYKSPRIYSSFTYPKLPYWFFKPECFFNFQEKMSSHPPNKNPFLSRSITVSSKPGIFTLDGYQVEVPPRFGACHEVIDYYLLWKNTLNLFTDFGKHLYEFRLFFGWQDGASHYFCQEFPKCLQKLPNLKRLELARTYLLPIDYWDDENLNGISFTSHHPYLTQLRIDYDAIPIVLADLIVSCFSSQLKILELHNGRREWIELKGSHIFPKLNSFQKELSILNSNEEGIKVTNWLNKITAPLLSRLTVATSYAFLSIKQDIFHWLILFPKLKYLEANSERINFDVKCLIVEDETFTEEDTNSLASLEYLKIYDTPWLTFNFLQWLPALRHLHIVTSSAPTAHTILSSSKIFLRDHIQTGQLYDSNIWSILPSLRTITLTVPHWIPKTEFKFDRTTLNELKRSAVIKSHDDYPLRKDILMFLEENARLELRFREYWEQCTFGSCGGYVNISDESGDDSDTDEYNDDSDTFDEFEDFLDSIEHELDQLDNFEEKVTRIMECRDLRKRKNKKVIKYMIVKN